MKIIKYIDKTKITFKYYLNKNLKAKDKNCYPVYLSIMVKKQHQKIRSIIKPYVSNESELRQFNKDIQTETTEIFNTILNRWNSPNFNLSKARQTKPQKHYDNYNYNLIAEYIQTKYNKELSNKEISDLIYTINKAKQQPRTKPESHKQLSINFIHKLKI